MEQQEELINRGTASNQGGLCCLLLLSPFYVSPNGTREVYAVFHPTVVPPHHTRAPPVFPPYDYRVADRLFSQQ